LKIAPDLNHAIIWVKIFYLQNRGLLKMAIFISHGQEWYKLIVSSVLRQQHFSSTKSGRKSLIMDEN
jgi:hypothetical protein